MKAFDFNQSLVPPPDFDLDDVRAQGSYLRLVYRKVTAQNDSYRDTTFVMVYLNDMGREVLRTVAEHREFFPTVIAPEPPPVGRWFRIQNSFYVVLEAIQEMFR